MITKPIRWGIIAPGRIAHKFAQDLLQVADSQLVAVASRDLARARAFAQEYGAPYAYGSYEEIVTCPALDVVYIASPHVGHHAHTMLCLQAGIPVLCEKPFAMDTAQVTEMVQTARAKQVFLMEALWTRFMPTTLKTLDLVQSGAIGKVLGVKADFGFKAPYDPERRTFNKDLGGGALLDIGIYPLFWSYLLLGKPTQIAAQAVYGPTGVDEATGMTLTYADGSFAFLDCTFLAKTRCEAFVYGEKGTIGIHSRWHESQGLTVEYEDGRTETHTFERPTWGYQYEIEAVNTCLKTHQTESTLWSLDHSLDLIHLLDSARAEVGLRYSV
ncbi:MAG: Gfo/Idh/MocA family oxidoreductase [Spirosomaceae bacterium]|jgi:predicted dehydrogenase|nr:Gfo/Idh/MocA family oxidoreductase [Spirosomataceae bacterium]